MRPHDRNAMSLEALLKTHVVNRGTLLLSVLSFFLWNSAAIGQTAPVLNTIFQSGGQSGTTFEVSVAGSHLESLEKLQSNILGFACELISQNRFRVTIPSTTTPGLYDLWAIGENGLSGPRTFSVGRHQEVVEVEPVAPDSAAMPMPLDTVLNGQLDKPGDVDEFRIQATAGQRIILECTAERIDSSLRAVLEVFDDRGRRIAVNRGYFGIDPLIDFVAPADGSYVVRVQDLTSSGGAGYYYRLEFDTQPRVLFTLPSVVQRGQATRVTLFGWNLPDSKASNAPAAEDAEQTELRADSQSEQQSRFQAGEFEQLEVLIPAALTQNSRRLPLRLEPSQTIPAANSFPYYLAGSDAPVLIGLSDVPVSLDQSDNHTPGTAQNVSIGCEISGQLIEASEQDWFVIDARRGEVIYLEAFGQRIASPVDLQISVYDGVKQSLLVQFNDHPGNPGDELFTSHLDPTGRWVCPNDGRYLIAVRNLNKAVRRDPRRVYRLSLRREEADFEVVAIPAVDGAQSLNVPKGGRQSINLIALRQRGHTGAIRVSAKNLPGGIECPDVWFGPEVNHVTMVVSADQGCETLIDQLTLEAFDDAGNIIRRDVQFGTIIRDGAPKERGRLVSGLPFAVVGSAPLRISANAHEMIEHQLYGSLPARHFQGGAVDVAVEFERRDASHQAPVRLMAVGLPDQIVNQTAIIQAGQSRGYVTFALPRTLPIGRYSFVIVAETTVTADDGKLENARVHSAPVVIDVQPAAFEVDVDPFAVTKARRGDTIQIAYSARRRNGFIGKMHTELAASGIVTDVPGLLGRGETFTGQTETGSLQIVVNKDAPLGPMSFLRLFTVGVVEDEPIFYGSRFLSLEIVE